LVKEELVQGNGTATYIEGGIREITSEIRNRDPKLRREALNYYNMVCCICEQDFSKIYGDMGDNYLEIHHLIPISDGERKNTVKDVRVVCANCHRMIHSVGKDGVPIEELSENIKQNKEKSKSL
jgi:5-methylcytosine-specific restriction protein A